MKLKPITIEAGRLIQNWRSITLKRDGMQITFKNKNLYSKSMLRNDRFGHILRILRNSNFPDCIGEMYIENGNVFDVSRSDNWGRARFMPFDLLIDKPFEERQKLLDNLIDSIDSEFLTKPIRFNDLTEAWNYVLENREEGLVLKVGNIWYKMKLLQEDKVEIKSWEQGRDKGTFLLVNNNRVSGTSMEFVDAYNQLKRKGRVFAEIEYPFITEQGHYFQPRLRRIFCEV